MALVLLSRRLQVEADHDVDRAADVDTAAHRIKRLRYCQENKVSKLGSRYATDRPLENVSSQEDFEGRTDNPYSLASVGVVYHQTTAVCDVIKKGE